MYEDRVVSFSHPDAISIADPLTSVLRAGARRLLAEAVEAEVEDFIAAHAEFVDDAGHRRVVRHGYMPERDVQTGVGAVAVRRPRIRDRYPDAAGGRIRFRSSILPPYLRRAKSVEELLPWLYLKGISTGDFGEALAALLGPDAPGLSATTIARLK
ncbi:MAG: IS256 family transposase, partial [Alphaproteobacteria bacterium]|nr:IS256 family transposase [Alphaproteobacteria bacterium]